MFNNPVSLGGIFAETTGGHVTAASLAFQRQSGVGVNSLGEFITSFVSLTPISGDLQPVTGNLRRLVQGQVVQVEAIFIVRGNPDIQVGDRTQVSAAWLEVISVDRFGTEQAEISLQWIGR